MNIAVIGSTGQLGSDIVKVFSNHDLIPLNHEDIEATDRTSVEKLKGFSPEVVINTAAYHKTDDLEDNPDKAFQVNAVGAKNIAEVCREMGAVVAYISTDYVFGGTTDTLHDEYHTPNPINTYGVSKLAGEHFTQLAQHYYVFRVASLFGTAGASGKGGNFVETMIKKAKEGEPLKVVDDQHMSPTYTRDAAETMKVILEEELPYGTYHTSNSGVATWFEFASAIFELTGLQPELSRIRTSELPLKARRPEFSALASKKLLEKDLKMRDWKSALEAYLKEKGHI